MAKILDKINKIRTAVLGKEVRGALADGLDAVNKETESTTEKQNHLEDTFDQLVIDAGNSNAEVVDARVDKTNNKTYSKIGDRMDEVSSQLAQMLLDIIKKDGSVKMSGSLLPEDINVSLGSLQNIWNDVFINNNSANFSIKSWINTLYTSNLFENNKFRFNNSDGNGEGLIKPSWGGYYIFFHVAVDIGSPARYIIGYGARHQGVSGTHTITKLSNNGLDYGSKNSQGTQVINGATADVVRQFVIACIN